MKKILLYNVILGFIITCLCTSLSAQDMQYPSAVDMEMTEAKKRVDNYLTMKKMGYEEKEIFEDLGNANFLNENFETALFWYNKLKTVSERNELIDSYQQRYEHSLAMTGHTTAKKASIHKNWLAQIKADYQIDSSPLRNEAINAMADAYTESKLERLVDNQILNKKGIETANDLQKAYKTPIAFTANGNTAYFSKALYMKPLTGIFSKKELVHKIYRADKVNGKWETIREVAVSPKGSSALHPTISADGKRLFFASNMPGTFGAYDIYVTTIRHNGSFERPKNLGKKVNTKEDELYPNLVGSNTLFFASEGHKGHGGLDMYMAQVGRNKVGLAMNLGTPINSAHDDFALSLVNKEGMGYVMTNRGNGSGGLQKVAFSYTDTKNRELETKRDYNVLAAFNDNLKVDYTSSVFEDEQP